MVEVTQQMIADARQAYSKATGCEDTPHVLDGWIDDALRPAIEAALAHVSVPAPSGGGVEEAIRLAEIGEYLFNRSYSYGNGYDEPREFGIEWQWQQSKPDEFGEGALLAEATKWHSDMAEDGIVTEASKLRSALTPTKPDEDRMREPCRAELVELLAHFERLGIKNKAAYERALQDFRAALANTSEAP